MTPEVVQAIEEIRQTFPEHQVEAEPDADGGAHVVVHDLSLEQQYVPRTTWMGFQITFQYPRADVYPHFVDGELHRVNGQPLGEGFSGPIPWRDRSAIQVSRRSNRWNAAHDTAAAKLVKVLEWMKSK